MTGLATPSPSRSTGGRLLALLIALLLVVGSLPGHAAMDLGSTGHADCLTPHMQMPDGAATDPVKDAEPRADTFGCSACSALARGMHLALTEPASPTIAPAVAFVARSPQPPRRPPRA